jgi:hypothetical protein
MRQIRIGDVTIDSIIERDGPWRVSAVSSPAYNPEAARRHLAEMDNFGFDPESGKIGHYLPDLRGPLTASHDSGRYMQR